MSGCQVGAWRQSKKSLATCFHLRSLFPYIDRSLRAAMDFECVRSTLTFVVDCRVAVQVAMQVEEDEKEKDEQKLLWYP